MIGTLFILIILFPELYIGNLHSLLVKIEEEVILIINE